MSADLCRSCGDASELIRQILNAQISPTYNELFKALKDVKDIVDGSYTPQDTQPNFYAQNGAIQVILSIKGKLDALGRLRSHANCTFSVENVHNKTVCLDPSLATDRIAASFLSVIMALEIAEEIGLKSIWS